MTQEEGLIGSELAIAAVVKHPECFVTKASVFLEAGFNEDYRIFRRTEALLCLVGMMNKGVLQKVPVEKSVIKALAKASSEYLRSSISDHKRFVCLFCAIFLVHLYFWKHYAY
ncbi:hypothetical protein COOONC_26078 [Cooperia oncophora]